MECGVVWYRCDEAHDSESGVASYATQITRQTKRKIATWWLGGKFGVMRHVVVGWHSLCSVSHGGWGHSLCCVPRGGWGHSLCSVWHGMQHKAY